MAKANPRSRRKRTPRKPKDGEELHPRKLKGSLLHEFRAASLSFELKGQKLATVEAELNTMSMDSTHAPVFIKLARKQALIDEIKEETVVFAGVQKKIADKFGIPLDKLHEYEFDTDTGALTPSNLKN